MHEETASLLASVVFISKLFLLERRLNRSSTKKLIGRTKSIGCTLDTRKYLELHLGTLLCNCQDIHKIKSKSIIINFRKGSFSIAVWGIFPNEVRLWQRFCAPINSNDIQ